MPPEDPLYERDPQAWNQLLAEGNASQPRKRVGADALIRDPEGRILLVDPTYKPGWDLPGGMSEANESPTDTITRELSEELGLTLTPGPLLCLDWVPPHGPWDDSLMFLFDAGTLTNTEAAAITCTSLEIARFAFYSKCQALNLLPGRQRVRLEAALASLDEGHPVYLQDGCFWQS
ncbi:NUDIX hydrolase [Actinocorallia sp. A-T 12471]|uniref:NUDIX hydrolase n=1 Tax=Actinocorallia sp. A-T 12471 TaxID=3089813 RepID=UPI0029D0E5C6|nr:NUDIX hydrolase [Actinocorallia sp. A-T 12471]MDX6738693.1 NUDIX hydrolase [Actinocorallia sp. A-T 12471]